MLFFISIIILRDGGWRGGRKTKKVLTTNCLNVFRTHIKKQDVRWYFRLLDFGACSACIILIHRASSGVAINRSYTPYDFSHIPRSNSIPIKFIKIQRRKNSELFTHMRTVHTQDDHCWLQNEYWLSRHPAFTSDVHNKTNNIRYYSIIIYLR